jgi:hypothetical protein
MKITIGSYIILKENHWEIIKTFNEISQKIKVNFQYSDFMICSSYGNKNTYSCEKKDIIKKFFDIFKIKKITKYSQGVDIVFFDNKPKIHIYQITGNLKNCTIIEKYFDII